MRPINRATKHEGYPCNESETKILTEGTGKSPDRGTQKLQEDEEDNISGKARWMKKNSLVLSVILSLLITVGGTFFVFPFNSPWFSFKLKSVKQDEIHQKIIKTGSGVEFNSNITGGNLMHVHESESNGSKEFHFYLGISGDCCTNEESSPRFWFYFKLKGLKEGLHTFTVANLNFNQAVWDNGMVPVLKRGNSPWEYIREFPLAIKKIDEKNMALTWKHMSRGTKEEVEMALSFPWTLEQNVKWIFNTIHKVGKRNDLYLHSEILDYTEAGGPVEAFHLSTLKGISKVRFGNVTALFPDAEEKRARVFLHKRYVVLLARTVAFGSPSNFVVKGLVDSLFKEQDQAKKFFKNYVLVVIPMINVDGANHGYTINSASGRSIDKMFTGPTGIMKSVKVYLLNLQKKVRIHSVIELRTQIDNPDHTIAVKAFENPRDEFQALCIPYLLHLHNPKIQFNKVSLFSPNSTKLQGRYGLYGDLACQRILVIGVSMWGKHRKKGDYQIFIGDKRYVRSSKGRHTIKHFINLGRDLMRTLVDSHHLLNGGEKKRHTYKVGRLRDRIKEELRRLNFGLIHKPLQDQAPKKSPTI